MAGTIGLTANIANSPAIRREWEGGVPPMYTHYVPTDLNEDGTAELLGGFKLSNGVCGTCHMVLPATRVCEECS